MAGARQPASPDILLRLRLPYLVARTRVAATKRRDQ
jgi:hypothetical protein